MKGKVNYDPLKITLIEKGLELKDLQNENGGIINKRTVHKFRHNHTMNIQTVIAVCVYLDVPIEKVVKVV